MSKDIWEMTKGPSMFSETDRMAMLTGLAKGIADSEKKRQQRTATASQRVKDDFEDNDTWGIRNHRDRCGCEWCEFLDAVGLARTIDTEVGLWIFGVDQGN